MRKSTIFIAFSAIAMQAAAAISDLPANPTATLITDPVPGTEPTVLVKSGTGFIRIDNQLDVLPADGSLTKMIRTDDKIYLSDIFSWTPSAGWIEGSVEGSKVTFRLPQIVKSEMADIDGVLTPQQYYAVACDMVVRNGAADMVPTTEQTYVMNIADDGSLIPEDPELFMGSFIFDGRSWAWNLSGDFYGSLSPQTQTPVEAPENITFSPMVLTYPHILYGGTYARPLEVAFDGNDCYIKGAATGISDLQDSIIKGSRQGRVVSFGSNQFLGNSWLFGFTQYFIGGETEYEDSFQYGQVPVFTPADMMEWVYDDQTGTLTSDMSFIIVPSPQEDSENLYYENIYIAPSIYPVSPESHVSNLITPEVSFTPASAGMPNVIDFAVSMVSADNQILDMDKLYFEIYMDGAPFEFSPSIDPALKQPASRIQVGTTDYYCFVAAEEIIQMVAIPEMNFTDLALRLVYLADPENPAYSDFVYVKGSGVDTIDAIPSGAPEYLDIQGRCLSGMPRGGISIRRTPLSDGSVRYEKILNRR